MQQMFQLVFIFIFFLYRQNTTTATNTKYILKPQEQHTQNRLPFFFLFPSTYLSTSLEIFRNGPNWGCLFLFCFFIIIKIVIIGAGDGHTCVWLGGLLSSLPESSTCCARRAALASCRMWAIRSSVTALSSVLVATDDPPVSFPGK